jgi:hypothetical protein
VPRVCAGEKRLRSLLSRTAEWNSAAAREAAACGCEAGADDDGRALAAALRAKASARLRKAHLFRLCRRWGYACDLWRRGRAHAAPWRAHAAHATHAAPPPLALPLPRSSSFAACLGAPPCRDAALHFISTQLRPLALAGAVSTEGASAREAAARLGGGGHLTLELADGFQLSVTWLSRLQQEWARQHAALLRWQRRLSDAERQQAAWVVLASPGAAGAYMLDDALMRLQALCSSHLAAVGRSVQRIDGGSAQGAWLAEMGTTATQALSWHARVLALLHDFKAAPAGAFADVAAAVLELLVVVAATQAAHMERRVAWVRESAQQKSERCHSGVDATLAVDDAPQRMELCDMPLPRRLGACGVQLLDLDEVS